MSEYHVVWAIDIDAESPQEAAKLANEILQEPGNDAVVFTVVDEDGKGVIVDLIEAVEDQPS